MEITLEDHSLLRDTFSLICPSEGKLRLLPLDTASSKVKLPRKAIFPLYVVPQGMFRYIYILTIEVTVAAESLNSVLWPQTG